MEVGCNQVHRAIKFGPAKNVKAYMQEKGRAGKHKKQKSLLQKKCGGGGGKVRNRFACSKELL